MEKLKASTPFIFKGNRVQLDEFNSFLLESIDGAIKAIYHMAMISWILSHIYSYVVFNFYGKPAFSYGTKKTFNENFLKSISGDTAESGVFKTRCQNDTRASQNWRWELHRLAEVIRYSNLK